MNQIYPYWELLVVDDHSTDGTREIVQSYADKRICCICQSKNNGVAVARNVGINAAKGRYIAFLDSDDLWLPNKLMKQISFMKRNKYHFTYTEYRPFVDLPSNAGKLVRTSDFVDYRSLLKGNDIGCLTVMLDRAYYGKVEMPSVRHEDYVTWLNLLKPGRCAYSLHEDLARYRKSNTSTKAEALAIKLAVEDAIKNNFNPKNVVIYTDQKPFVFNNFNKSFSLLKELREVLESKGFCNFKYIRSTHSLDGIKPEYLNARTRNSYAVHKLAEENFTKINRYRRYQLKKKQNQKNKG